MSSSPSCARCKKNLPSGSARCFIESRWWCGDCLYLEEYGPVELHPIRRQGRIEQPSLFDAEQFARRGETPAPTAERNH